MRHLSLGTAFLTLWGTRKEIKNVSLVIYVKPNCPYCQQARDHFNAQGTPFIEYDAQTDRARRQEMLALSAGDPTVPCIVENGVYQSSGWGNPPRG